MSPHYDDLDGSGKPRDQREPVELNRPFGPLSFAVEGGTIPSGTALRHAVARPGRSRD